MTPGRRPEGAPTRRPGRIRIIRGVMLAAALAGCASGGPGATWTGEGNPPRLSPSGGTEWTGMASGEAAVAEVGGHPIPASRYRRALIEAGPKTDPALVLQALIDREALAQRAAQADPEGILEPAQETYRQALGQRLLRDRLDESLPLDAIPLAQLEQWFRLPAVWARFHHHRIFRVRDYQWICCAGDPAGCSSPDAQACFQEGADAMPRLLDRVRVEPMDPEDIPLMTERWRSIAPRLTYQAYDFAWDEDRRIQKGSDLFDDAVVEAVVATPPGRFAAKPVRSRYGWHVLFVAASEPPAQQDLNDPQVRQEVARTFRVRFQQQRLIELLISLIPVQGFRSLEQAFPLGPPPGTRPRWAAKVDGITLAEAIAVSEREKEDQGF